MNIKKELEKLIDYISCNSSFSASEIWRPILGLALIKKLYPDFSLEGENLQTKLIEISKEIEENNKQIKGILFKSYEKLDSKLLDEIIDFVEAIKEEEDYLGTVYNLLLEKYKCSSQELFGTHYTPSSLTDMIVRILDIQEGTVVDPACGSGGFFLAVKRHLEEENKCDICKDKVRFYGQELDEEASKLGNLNLLINDLKGEIVCGNTFFDDKITPLLAKHEHNKYLLWETKEKQEFFGNLWKEYYEYLGKPEEERGRFPLDKYHYLVCDSMRIGKLFEAWKAKEDIKI